jgi:phage shock protein A
MDRFEKLVKAMLEAMLGKMENPAVMLERHYQSLQAELLQLRATVAASKSQAANLESQIQKKKAKQEDASALESSLEKLKESIASLETRLSELEQEVMKTYTKKQVLIARDKASRATFTANQLLLKQKDPWTLINAMENQ